jgi:hypothetical protein
MMAYVEGSPNHSWDIHIYAQISKKYREKFLDGKESKMIDEGHDSSEGCTGTCPAGVATGATA